MSFSIHTSSGVLVDRAASFEAAEQYVRLNQSEYKRPLKIKSPPAPPADVVQVAAPAPTKGGKRVRR